MKIYLLVSFKVLGHNPPQVRQQNPSPVGLGIPKLDSRLPKTRGAQRGDMIPNLNENTW